jgi:hypothetical protein
MTACRQIANPALCFIFSILFLGILPARAQSRDELLKRQFKLFGGFSFPVGDFGISATPEAGLAETGFTLGTEFCSEVAEHFEIGAGATFNLHGVDITQYRILFPGVGLSAGSWDLFWFLGAVGFNTPVSSSVNLYGHGNMGLLVANSPDITAFAGNNSIRVASATGTSIGYGLSFGALIDHRFDAGFRYVTGEPGFTVNGLTGKQSISVINLTFGYVFH